VRTACEPAKKTICNLGASGFRDNQPIPQIHRSAGGLRIESFPEILTSSAGHLDQRSRRSRGPPLGSTVPRHRESAAQLRAVPLGGGRIGVAHRRNRDRSHPAAPHFRSDPFSRDCGGGPPVGKFDRPNSRAAAKARPLGACSFQSPPHSIRKTDPLFWCAGHGRAPGLEPAAHPSSHPRRPGTSMDRARPQIGPGCHSAPRMGSEPVPYSMEPVPSGAGSDPSLAIRLDGWIRVSGGLAAFPRDFQLRDVGLQPADSLQCACHRRHPASRSGQFIADAGLDSAPQLLASQPLKGFAVRDRGLLRRYRPRRGPHTNQTLINRSQNRLSAPSQQLPLPSIAIGL